MNADNRYKPFVREIEAASGRYRASDVFVDTCRKMGGIYYTPPAVARLFSRPVDPACGTGAFLMTNPPFCEAAKTL